MSSEILLILIILLFIAREYFHYKEFEKLINLIQVKSPVKEKVTPNQVIKEEENQLSIDDPDFDIKKINKVITNGQEIPITIV